MKRKLIFLIELSIIFVLLNVVAHIMGQYFIKDYMFCELSGGSFLSSLLFVLFFSSFQCFFFSKYLKGVIPPLSLSILFFLIVCFDESGYGPEFVYIIVSGFSKPIYLLSFLIDKIPFNYLRLTVWDLTYSFGFGLYLFSVYYLVKCIIYPFSMALKKAMNP